MIVRFDSVTDAVSVALKRRAAHAALAAACLALSGFASAQGGSAAQAVSAPAPTFRFIGRYVVEPGQSLHDIAVELTQSHDKGLLASVSKAFFEANPSAFSHNDPSRLKVGAVLNVPAVPGIVSPDSPDAPQTAASVSAATVAAASVPAAPVAPAAQAAASAPAAGVAAPTPAASAASAPAATSAPAAVSAPEAVASGAAGASSVEPASAGAAGAGAAGAASQAMATASSGASATAAASQAGAATSPSDGHVWSGAIQAAPASGAAPSQAASAAVPGPVSSLQQLLTLKNHVLMALQKHGIGHAPGQAASAVNGASAPVAGTAGTNASAPRMFGLELSPTTAGVAAAIVVLLLAWVLTVLRRKGKTRALATTEAASDVVEPPVLDTPLPTSGAAATAATAAYAAVQREEAPVQSTVARVDTEPTEPTEPVAAQPEPAEQRETPRDAEQRSDVAGEAAGFAAAAEAAASVSPSQHSHTPGPVEPEEAVQPELPVPSPVADTPVTAPAASTELPAETAPPTGALEEFPADAVSALGDIDMSLPPRVTDTFAPIPTEPVASPAATAEQSEPLAPEDADDTDEAPHAIPAFEEGSASGLHTPRFGALTLDFDLNLPPDSAEPISVFTPAQLARIARNKLELAHEYIALGDVAGARALINEVIESNDGATRADAQALLSTLAPLS